MGHSEVAENYFKLAGDNPDLSKFLDYACEQLFKAYVFKSIKEAKKHFLLKQKQQYENITCLDTLADIEELSVNDDYNYCFIDLIKNLSDKQQEFLILHYHYGLRVSDVAKRMHISCQAVNGIKNRALTALHKELLMQNNECSHLYPQRSTNT